MVRTYVQRCCRTARRGQGSRRAHTFQSAPGATTMSFIDTVRWPLACAAACTRRIFSRTPATWGSPERVGRRPGCCRQCGGMAQRRRSWGCCRNPRHQRQSISHKGSAVLTCGVLVQHWVRLDGVNRARHLGLRHVRLELLVGVQRRHRLAEQSRPGLSQRMRGTHSGWARPAMGSQRSPFGC